MNPKFKVETIAPFTLWSRFVDKPELTLTTLSLTGTYEELRPYMTITKKWHWFQSYVTVKIDHPLLQQYYILSKERYVQFVHKDDESEFNIQFDGQTLVIGPIKNQEKSIKDAVTKAFDIAYTSCTDFESMNSFSAELIFNSFKNSIQWPPHIMDMLEHLSSELDNLEVLKLKLAKRRFEFIQAQTHAHPAVVAHAMLRGTRKVFEPTRFNLERMIPVTTYYWTKGMFTVWYKAPPLDPTLQNVVQGPCVEDPVLFYAVDQNLDDWIKLNDAFDAHNYTTENFLNTSSCHPQYPVSSNRPQWLINQAKRKFRKLTETILAANTLEPLPLFMETDWPQDIRQMETELWQALLMFADKVQFFIESRADLLRQLPVPKEHILSLANEQRLDLTDYTSKALTALYLYNVYNHPIYTPATLL